MPSVKILMKAVVSQAFREHSVLKREVAIGLDQRLGHCSESRSCSAQTPQ